LAHPESGQGRISGLGHLRRSEKKSEAPGVKEVHSASGGRGGEVFA